MLFRAAVATVVYFLVLLIPSAWATTTYQEVTVTVNSSSNFACLIGPNTPQAPPPIAATIGWTCSYNMDPSNSFYQTLSNWMDYPSGTDLSKQWHCLHGFTHGFIPCDTSHIFVTNDPIDGKQSIDFALLPSDNNATYDSSLLEINTSDSNTQNNQPTNTWSLTWPQNVYMEVVWRVDYGGGSITTCTDGQTSSQFQCVSTDGTGPEGWDTYSAGDAGSGYEATFGEFYSPSNYTQQCGGGANRNNNTFTNGPCVSKITNGYIVQDEMYTCPGRVGGSNDCYLCYLDALAAQGPGQNATCGAMGYPGNGFNMYGARRNFNFQEGNQNHGFDCTGCEFSHTTWPQQINHYVRSVLVWTCSTAFTNVPNLPISDSQIGQPYSCPPPSSNGGATAGTLTGPDANGFIYWH